MKVNGAVAALLSLASAVPVAAQQVPADPPHPGVEQAVDRQRSGLAHAIGTGRCEPADAEALLVCGRRNDGFRVPFPDARADGDRVGLVAGESPSASRAYAATAQSPCTAIGRAQRCGGGLSIFTAIMVAAKVIKALRDQGD
jgi:hypothetical protein